MTDCYDSPSIAAQGVVAAPGFERPIAGQGRDDGNAVGLQTLDQPRARITRLYDRRNDQVSLDEVERIVI